jgi:hypothetical protein
VKGWALGASLSLSPLSYRTGTPNPSQPGSQPQGPGDVTSVARASPLVASVAPPRRWNARRDASIRAPCDSPAHPPARQGDKKGRPPAADSDKRRARKQIRSTQARRYITSHHITSHLISSHVSSSSLTQSLTHSLSHSLTHSLSLTYLLIAGGRRGSLTQTLLAQRRLGRYWGGYWDAIAYCCCSPDTTTVTYSLPSCLRTSAVPLSTHRSLLCSALLCSTRSESLAARPRESGLPRCEPSWPTRDVPPLGARYAAFRDVDDQTPAARRPGYGV